MHSKDVPEMLNFLSLKDIGDLFSDIPPDVRVDGINIPAGISEEKLLDEASAIASLNRLPSISFLGKGAYRRFIPSVVDHVSSIPQFQTAYTPYQAEISQGMLQALFEYQSVISDLTGMDMTNSSMYDGPTAAGEAARMAYRCSEGDTFLVPDIIDRNVLSVIQNYLHGLPVKITSYMVDRKTGKIDLADLASKVDRNVFGIFAGIPNALGILDDNVFRIQEIKGNAMLVTYYDPISLGAVKPPGEYGTDIAVAEGQQLGIHLAMGGPYLGLFSFRKEYVRKSPGRLIGKTTDSDGNPAYVMTLQTREQHIRRDRAMSNICTNQALMAISALSYLSAMGSKGLRSVSAATLKNSRKLIDALEKTGAGKYPFNAIPFSDVLFKMHLSSSDLAARLGESGISGGIPARDLITFPEEGYHFFSVTELNGDEEIEALAHALGGATR